LRWLRTKWVSQNAFGESPKDLAGKAEVLVVQGPADTMAFAKGLNVIEATTNYLLVLAQSGKITVAE
jgi:hypothetical protein